MINLILYYGTSMLYFNWQISCECILQRYNRKKQINVILKYVGKNKYITSKIFFFRFSFNGTTEYLLII